MSIHSKRKLFAIALCAVATTGLSLPAMAGGSNCKQQMTRSDAEGTAVGQIHASEHAAQADERFDRMDTNKDGSITAAEIDASHGAESLAWASHRTSSVEKLKQLDSDRDGALTRAEYAEGSQKMFIKLDADGNGTLTANEMNVERMTARDLE